MLFLHISELYDLEVLQCNGGGKHREEVYIPPEENTEKPIFMHLFLSIWCNIMSERHAAIIGRSYM